MSPFKDKLRNRDYQREYKASQRAKEREKQAEISQQAEQLKESPPPSVIGDLTNEVQTLKDELAPDQVKVREYSEKVKTLEGELGLGPRHLPSLIKDFEPEQRVKAENELADARRVFQLYQERIRAKNSEILRKQEALNQAQRNADLVRRNIQSLVDGPKGAQIAAQVQRFLDESLKYHNMAENLQAQTDAEITKFYVELLRLTGSKEV